MIKIVIIEDDQTIAEGLRYSIEYNKKYNVSGIYNSAEDALKEIKVDNPGIIILDIDLPGKSGLEIIPELKQILPDAEILMLTSSIEDDDIFNALRLGASGYLQKDLEIENLLEALDEIVSGGSPLSGNVARKVISSMRTESTDIQLTKQESALLKFMIDGYSNKEISEKMFISLPTVKFHTSNIYKKLGVGSRAEAVAKAINMKLV